jgi:hypothetical protein
MSYQVPTSYLLNYITTLGGTLETLYNLVALKGPVSIEQLRSQVDYRPDDGSEDHVKNGLNFLHTLGLITLGDDGYATDGDPAEGVLFKLKVVAALRKLSNYQGDFLRLHDVLIRDGLTSVTDVDLITILNRKDFTTPGETDINTNKTRWWIRTSDYLGIVQQLNRLTRILVMPDADLVLAMLQEAGANGKQIAVVDWLRYVESRYIYTLRTDGALHPGMIAVLNELNARNRVRLIYKDDAQAFQLAPGKSATHLLLVEEANSNA